MKREYQVKGCIEEDGGVRWAEEGEQAQFWGLYQLEDDGICWKWRADFDSEEAARAALASAEAGIYPDKSAADLMTREEVFAVFEHLSHANKVCGTALFGMSLASLCVLDAMVAVVEHRLAQAREIIDAVRERALANGDET